MNIVKLESFSVIGIKVRTTNENEQAAKDIVALWNTFMSQNCIDKKPNKVSTAVFSIYTNYESDYTKPYDTILGCKVSSLDKIPEGMVGHSFKASTYKEFKAQGNLSAGIVYKKWLEIWGADLERLYTADFEVYGDTAKDTTNAEVPIYVAVKE